MEVERWQGEMIRTHAFPADVVAVAKGEERRMAMSGMKSSFIVAVYGCLCGRIVGIERRGNSRFRGRACFEIS